MRYDICSECIPVFFISAAYTVNRKQKLYLTSATSDLKTYRLNSKLTNEPVNWMGVSNILHYYTQEDGLTIHIYSFLSL